MRPPRLARSRAAGIQIATRPEATGHGGGEPRQWRRARGCLRVSEDHTWPKWRDDPRQCGGGDLVRHASGDRLHRVRFSRAAVPGPAGADLVRGASTRDVRHGTLCDLRHILPAHRRVPGGQRVCGGWRPSRVPADTETVSYTHLTLPTILR